MNEPASVPSRLYSSVSPVSASLAAGMAPPTSVSAALFSATSRSAVGSSNTGALLVRGGAASSSSRVSVRFAGAVTLVADTVPETVTVLSAASTSLSTPVIVTEPVLVVAFSAKLRTRLALRRKSAATAGDTAAAATVTVKAAAEAGDTVAVTVLTPPSSPIEPADSARVTVGVVVSLSVTVTATPAIVMPL